MAHLYQHMTATVAAVLLAASLWLPAAQAGNAPSSSVAGPVMATYSLPLVA